MSDLVGRALAALAASPPARKRSRRKAAFLLALGSDAPELLLKVNEHAALAPWRRLARSRARHSLACAARLSAAGVATALPIAVGELRRGPLLERSYELVPWLSDAIDLERARAERSGTPATRRARERAFGTLVRALHDAGVDQDDLAPNNFLWRPDAMPRVLALDFERARVRSRVTWQARHRALAKLDRYCAGASSSTRMRFLVAYASGDRDAARATWRAIEASAVQLMRRDVRRWCRVGARAGRRFEAFDAELGGARAHGLLRRGVDPAALRAALAAPGPGGWRAVPLAGGSAREARRCLGVALALHQRGLSLRPDALLQGASGTHIVFEQPAGVAPHPAGPGAAWVVAVDRLLALGSFDPRASRDAFVRSATCDRVWLIDPTVLAVGAAPSGAGRRAEARRLVARWCAADQLDEPR